MSETVSDHVAAKLLHHQGKTNDRTQKVIDQAKFKHVPKLLAVVDVLIIKQVLFNLFLELISCINSTVNFVSSDVIFVLFFE